MPTKQYITLFALLYVSCMTVQLVSAGGGGHGHGGNGGQSVQTPCGQAAQFFNQWWPQSVVNNVFQIICTQSGAVQAWASLQSVLGVPATGVLDQATFQALLNNANHALLAQQLYSRVSGVVTPSYMIG